MITGSGRCSKWKRLRSFVLKEFDRECPEHLDSPYLDDEVSNKALNPTPLRGAG